MCWDKLLFISARTPAPCFIYLAFLPNLQSHLTLLLTKRPAAHADFLNRVAWTCMDSELFWLSLGSIYYAASGEIWRCCFGQQPDWRIVLKRIHRDTRFTCYTDWYLEVLIWKSYFLCNIESSSLWKPDLHQDNPISVGTFGDDFASPRCTHWPSFPATGSQSLSVPLANCAKTWRAWFHSSHPFRLSYCYVDAKWKTGLGNVPNFLIPLVFCLFVYHALVLSIVIIYCKWKGFCFKIVLMTLCVPAF